jgi:hypothetical protein
MLVKWAAVFYDRCVDSGSVLLICGFHWLSRRTGRSVSLLIRVGSISWAVKNKRAEYEKTKRDAPPAESALSSPVVEGLVGGQSFLQGNDHPSCALLPLCCCCCCFLPIFFFFVVVCLGYRLAPGQDAVGNWTLSWRHRSAVCLMHWLVMRLECSAFFLLFFFSPSFFLWSGVCAGLPSLGSTLLTYIRPSYSP